MLSLWMKVAVDRKEEEAEKNGSPLNETKFDENPSNNCAWLHSVELLTS